MAKKFDFVGEAPVQYEQKCLCVLCLDTSGSMGFATSNESSAIMELQSGVQSFKDEILSDSTLADRLEIAIVEYNSNVTSHEPALAENLVIPNFVANGTTNTALALEESINLVEARKEWYKSTGQPYYRPWIILITDGDPDSVSEAMRVSSRMMQDVSNKKYTFLPIGVTGADMAFLHNISCEIPAMGLAGLKFTEFFKWLSASMGVIARSQPGDAVNIAEGMDTWQGGLTV
ncbi:MAG: vWA domain-containing protein [Bacteroidales bacterium]